MRKEHFFFDGSDSNGRWFALSESDRVHFNLQDDFRRNAAIASANLDLPRSGYWGELIYETYYRELFPGLDFIKFDADCGVFADMALAKDLQLWIKREGARDYRYTLIPQRPDFLKFAMPPYFLQSASRLAGPADSKNRESVRSLDKSKE
jgi:hypothetical protein